MKTDLKSAYAYKFMLWHNAQSKEKITFKDALEFTKHANEEKLLSASDVQFPVYKKWTKGGFEWMKMRREIHKVKRSDRLGSNSNKRGVK